MKAYLFLILFLCCCYPAKAGKEFDFNLNCKQAYSEIIQWKLSRGQALLNEEKKLHPDNLIPYFLENYIDFFELFFNEDPLLYRKKLENLSRRLDMMNQGPESSPFYLFTKSIIHFQWAAVKVKFGNYWDGGWEFRRSFLQVKTNQQKFPDFYPSELYRGAMQVAAGTIPDGYKWLSNMLGIKGTVKQGMQTLSDFLNRRDEWSQLFRSEAIFYYSYLRFYIGNDKQGVLEFLKKQPIDFVNNHLFAYLYANLSLNSQQSANVIQIIKARNRSAEYFSTPVWHLELGYALINRLDKEGVFELEQFLKNFKGKAYVRDVMQKLSWYYYLENNQVLANQYRAEILRKGAADMDADKQAFKEARSGLWPDKLLLKARLLNDGGYYREALALLHGKNYKDFTPPQDQTEFCYRVARLYDDLGADDEAIGFYKQAVGLGKDRKEYFAARAALHVGNIHEERGDCKGAIIWYQLCLNMKDHDFKNSLDQRAKAGLARCKGE